MRVQINGSDQYLLLWPIITACPADNHSTEPHGRTQFVCIVFGISVVCLTASNCRERLEDKVKIRQDQNKSTPPSIPYPNYPKKCMDQNDILMRCECFFMWAMNPRATCQTPAVTHTALQVDPPMGLYKPSNMNYFDSKISSITRCQILFMTFGCRLFFFPQWIKFRSYGVMGLQSMEEALSWFVAAF